MINRVKYLPALAVLAVLTAGAGSAGAADVTRTVRAGTAGPVAWWWVLTRDCLPGPLPLLTIITPPSHGAAELTLSSGTVPLGEVCAGRPLTARLVMYRPADGFHGVDTMTVGVAREAYLGGPVRGAEDIHITINVPAGPFPDEQKTTKKPPVVGRKAHSTDGPN